MMQPQLIDTSILLAMRKQEQDYACGDYLYQDGRCYTSLALPPTAIDEACRTSMMNWIQTIVNYFGLDTETMEISMSLLDRFLVTPSGQEAIHCRATYQLAAMTVLYIAVKIHCTEALTPKLMAKLSQGVYHLDQFEEMERIILRALAWRVNPPTGASFVRETLNLLPDSLFPSEDIRQSVLDMAQVQAEWDVGCYQFLSVKKSVLGFAAVKNALKAHQIGFNLPKLLQETLEEQHLDLDIKQARILQKTPRQALPAEESITIMPSSSSLAASVKDDKQSSKSLGDNASQLSKRPSAGKSPRAVIYGNAAA